MDLIRSGFATRAWLKHVLQIVVGLALLGLVLYFGDPDSLRRLTELRVLPLLGSFIATLGIALSIALRWHTLITSILGRSEAHWSDLYRYFLWNRLLGFIVPKDLSDIGGRTAMLAIRHQIPAHHAGVSVLLDRFFDVLIMTLLLGPAVLFLSKTAGAVVSISLMIFVAVIFYIALHLFYDSISGLITGTYNVMVGVARRLPLIRRKTLKKLDGFSVGKPDFAKAYLLSIVKFLCTVIRFIFFARAIEMPVSPFVFFLGTPMGQLSFLFAFTPGGLGIFEAGWYAILVQVGTPVSYIVPFLLGQRVFTVLFIGMLFVVDQLSLLFFAENE